jgi:hypothetical protein
MASSVSRAFLTSDLYKPVRAIGIPVFDNGLHNTYLHTKLEDLSGANGVNLQIKY